MTLITNKKTEFDLFHQPPFDGDTFDKKQDGTRLTGQLKKIVDCMQDEKWRTLDEIQLATSYPAASISAQLRHLRKEKFGKNTVNRRPRGDRSQGLYEYQLILNKESKFKINL